MRTVSLETLRLDALLRADMLNSQFVTAEEVNRYINQGYTELYDWLIDTGETYFLSSTTFSTAGLVAFGSPGTQPDRIALPPDFYQVRGVDVNIGAQQLITAHRFNFEERNRYKLIGSGFWYSEPVWYDIQGNFIVFMPGPEGTYIVTVWYYPAPLSLSDDKDVIDGVAGWEELIALDAAIKMLMREESFEAVDRLTQQKEAMKARIHARAPTRNAAEPPRVTDVERSSNGIGMWRRLV